VVGQAPRGDLSRAHCLALCVLPTPRGALRNSHSAPICSERGLPLKWGQGCRQWAFVWCVFSPGGPRVCVRQGGAYPAVPQWRVSLAAEQAILAVAAVDPGVATPHPLPTHTPHTP
jgi:hypothetical protein